MGMRAALVSGMVLAVVFFGGAPASEAQQPPPAPRAPAGQGGAIGGVQRPNRPPQPQGQRPVRDPRQPPAEGTATVRGRVVDAATGAAIPRAKVRNNGGRDNRGARVVTTDAEGVFTLTKVPAGSLFLTVEKAAYMPAMYPERRRTMRAGALMVADGQTIDNISIPMHRGSAITGRIVDAFGDPAENVTLQVMPVPKSSSASSFNRGFGRTFQGSNDIGEYRISRVEPGQYYLMATPQRRGPNMEDNANALARTFYPGVASVEQAQPLTVERGQSLSGVDFQMLETTLTRVSGFVVTSKGGPATRGHVSVRSTTGIKGMPSGFGFSQEGGSGIQNGTFELTLQPGEYVIEAMASADDGPSMNSSEMDRGQVKLMVGGEAMSGVTIVTGRGGTLSGRFVFKGSSPPPTNFQGFNIGMTGPNGTMGDDCRAFNRPAVNADGTFTAENVWGTCQVRGGGMTKGWTFEAVMHSGNDITNRAIEFDAGRSISGVEIVYSDRVGEIAVTVSDERGTPTQDYVAIAFPVEKEKWGDQRFMRFQVRSASMNTGSGPSGPAGGQAAFDGSRVVTSVSLVPQGSAYGGMVNSSFSGPVGMTGTGGSFSTLLAGDYFAVALEDAAAEDLRDPEYLERLAQIATRVSVTAGGTDSVQLRRAPPPN